MQVVHARADQLCWRSLRVRGNDVCGRPDDSMPHAPTVLTLPIRFNILEDDDAPLVREAQSSRVNLL